jgi:hypothetical protein
MKKEPSLHRKCLPLNFRSFTLLFLSIRVQIRRLFFIIYPFRRGIEFKMANTKIKNNKKRSRRENES